MMSTCLLETALPKRAHVDWKWPISREKYLTIDLVCKNAVALAYYGSCRLLVMDLWYYILKTWQQLFSGGFFLRNDITPRKVSPVAFSFITMTTDDNVWGLRLNVIRTRRKVSITALQAHRSHPTVGLGERSQLYDSNVPIMRSRQAVRGMRVHRGDVNVLFVTFSHFKMVLTKANLCWRPWDEDGGHYIQHSHACIFPLPTHDSIRVGKEEKTLGQKNTSYLTW